jgi:hypothetical protein
VHLDPDDEGSMYLWNVCILTHNYTVLQPNNKININTLFSMMESHVSIQFEFFM